MLRIANIIEESAVDGPGLRLVIFTQGCKHKCPGCHNPHTWSMTGGRILTMDELCEKLDNPLLTGITFSGGEPVEQMREIIAIIKELKKRFPNLDYLSFSGYTLEQIAKMPYGKEYLANLDYLIDGLYMQELRTTELPFRGSSNQKFYHLSTGKHFS